MIAVLNALMGLPPVVGLIEYIMLSRSGPFGMPGLLCTQTADKDEVNLSWARPHTKYANPYVRLFRKELLQPVNNVLKLRRRIWLFQKTSPLRAALLGGGAVIDGLVTKAMSASNPTLDGTRFIKPGGAVDILNDASGSSETPIFGHITRQQNPGIQLVTAIRANLTEAPANGRPANVGTARDSMGGQAIPRDGHAITFDNGLFEPDTANQLMRTHAGARWGDVIATADRMGLGPRVMQSNNDFGIAATF